MPITSIHIYVYIQTHTHKIWTSRVPLEGAQVPPLVHLPQFANHWVRVSCERKQYVNEMSPRGQQTGLLGVSV